MEYKVIIVDATETGIERPKKQKRYYLGKKKKHTIKTEIIIDKNTKAVICTQFSKGRRHDFKVFKESKTKINPGIEILADRGYQWVRKIHKNARLPKKGKSLKEEERKENKRVASERMVIERVIIEERDFH